MPDSRCAGARTTCLRRTGSANSLTSRSWVSVSMIAAHCAVGYFLSCHSRRPASRGEVSVPTIEAGHHCRAATGLMPRAVQSCAIEATDSPWSSTRVAASRIASASTGLISSPQDVPLLVVGLVGVGVDAGVPEPALPSADPSALARLAILGFADPGALDCAFPPRL